MRSRTKARVAVAAGVAAAAGAGVASGLIMRRRRGGDWIQDEHGTRWYMLTVNRNKDDLIAGLRPHPLALLGDDVEVMYRTTPDGMATEVAVRETGLTPTDGRRARAINSALRESKQLWESGAMLSPYGSTGHLAM